MASRPVGAVVDVPGVAWVFVSMLVRRALTLRNSVLLESREREVDGGASPLITRARHRTRARSRASGG